MSQSLKEQIEVSHWGIDPVPSEHRRLSAFDIAVLWGDLGIGLLVIVAGALLVAPAKDFGFALPLRGAVLAIVAGSIIGSVLLGLGALIGTREGLPTMVLLRPVLGRRGSWVPTILNAAQLIGWTAVELWAMALIANKLGEKLFGFSSFAGWLIFFSFLVLLLCLWGPLGVIRGWMEKFGVWILVAIGVAITAYTVPSVDLTGLWGKGSGGAFILGLPMDLVIAMPVSWVPLVADYNRFSKGGRGSFWGTFIGYGIANVWFFLLGVLLVLGVRNVGPDPQQIAIGILSIAGISVTGWLLLTGLLFGESDEAFADVYSSAISVRNIFPRADNRILVVVITIIGAFLAGRFTMLGYENFLFLLGSVFLPLLGVWFADYFVLGNNQARSQFRFWAFVSWILGFLVYHWIAPTPLDWWARLVKDVVGTPLSEKFVWLGASLPSFLAAGLAHIAIGSITRGRSRPSD